MKKLLLTLLAFSLLASVSMSANADVTLEMYKATKSSPELFNDYISGVGKGYFWANSILEDKKQPLLFCQPYTLALQRDNFIQILNTEIEAGHYTPNTHIEMILGIGLMKTFPCK